MKRRSPRVELRNVLILLLLLFPVSHGFADEDALEPILKSIRKTVSIRQDTQKNRDAWSEEQTELIRTYKALEAEQRQLETAKTDLTREILTLNANIKRMEQDRDRIRILKRDLIPFLYDLLDQVEGWVGSDLPFSTSERKERIRRLKERLRPEPDSAISIPDLDIALRDTMEILFLETGYGETAEVYPSTIRFQGNEKRVNVLRAGRVVLLCLTADQAHAGRYNVASKNWDPLPISAIPAIKSAMEMVQGRRADALVDLPIGRLVP